MYKSNRKGEIEGRERFSSQALTFLGHYILHVLYPVYSKIFSCRLSHFLPRYAEHYKDAENRLKIVQKNLQNM